MSGDRDTRSGGVLRKLEILAEDAKRRREVDGWVEAIKTAEAAAANKRGAVRRLYQVNYRIKQVESEDKGGAVDRREALTQLLKSLAPVERHQSTSSWIVGLHIERAVDIADLLMPPLDVRQDFLSVAELNVNRTTRGHARLKVP